MSGACKVHTKASTNYDAPHLVIIILAVLQYDREWPNERTAVTQSCFLVHLPEKLSYSQSNSTHAQFLTCKYVHSQQFNWSQLQTLHLNTTAPSHLYRSASLSDASQSTRTPYPTTDSAPAKLKQLRWDIHILHNSNADVKQLRFSSWIPNNAVQVGLNIRGGSKLKLD